MSSKAAKRRAEYKKREEKRNQKRNKIEALRKASTLEEMAKIMGIKL